MDIKDRSTQNKAAEHKIGGITYVVTVEQNAKASETLKAMLQKVIQERARAETKKVSD